MKHLLLLIACIGSIVLTPQSHAQENSALFFAGQKAYDEGNYDEAIEHYQVLLKKGETLGAVHYNLANAYFRNADLPRAVQQYRLAWYQAPRDPDCQANLRFALQAAGAVEPAPSILERYSQLFSEAEWIRISIAAYLLLMILLIVAVWVRPIRRPALNALLLPAGIILASAIGWWPWQGLKNHPEAVVVRSGTTALFGPIEGSTAHYKVPSAALVKIIQRNDRGWVEIEYAKKNGWIQADHIHAVSP